MKITITLNNIKIEREVPTSWDEVKFHQFIKVMKAKENFAEVLSVFVDIPAETLEKAKIINIDKLIQVFGFLKTEVPMIKPKTILGYEVPKDLGFETIGQFQDLKKAASESKGPEKFPLMCAIYCTKPYDWKVAEEKQNEFLNAPATEVLALGNFTLVKLIGLNLSKGINSQNQNTLLKKFRLAFKGWRMRMGFTVRFFLWKRRQAIAGKN